MRRIVLLVGLVLGLIVMANLWRAKSQILPLTNSWDLAVPFQHTPKGLSSMYSKDCGVCHVQHYEEWKKSTHSQAWTDLQFQAEIAKESSPYMCINCHIPLENQQEYLIKGLKDDDIYRPIKVKNPNFDPVLQSEGINCVSCHVRNDAIIGIHGGDDIPHKTIKDPEFLSEKLCISCHNAVENINKQLVCTFETGDEWKAGPYFGKKNCISCHMPEIERASTQGGEVRKGHFHSFPGSGIPKSNSHKPGMLIGYSILASEIKENYKQGELLTYNLKVTNEFAGHKVPTGDPERFFLFNFKIIDAKANIIVDTTYRIGEKWEWYPAAKKLEDNNLLPKEMRQFDLEYITKKKGSFNLITRVTKHRMDEVNAAYNKLTEDYPLFIEVSNDTLYFEVE